MNISDVIIDTSPDNWEELETETFTDAFIYFESIEEIE
jgi:hypothetical protein